jgi:hypothetical protein
MRHLLALDVADARRFLSGPTLAAAGPAPVDAAAAPAPATSVAPEPTTTRRKRPWAPLSLAAAMTVVVVILMVHRSATAPEPTVAPVPALSTVPPVALAPPVVSKPTEPTVLAPGAAASIPAHGDPIAARAGRHAHRDPTPVEEMMVERPSHPDDPAALIQQAHVLWEDHDDFNGALALLHRAEAAGGGAPAYVFAAAILIDQGRKDEAQRNLIEALRLDPQNALAKKLLPVAQAKPTE